MFFITLPSRNRCRPCPNAPTALPARRSGSVRLDLRRTFNDRTTLERRDFAVRRIPCHARETGGDDGDRGEYLRRCSCRRHWRQDMSIAICRQGRRQLQRLNLVSAPPLSAPAQEIFSANVERSVPANGEKPSGRLRILKRTVVLKFHKSFLHHVTRSVPVARDAGRELQQRNLKSS